MRMLRVVPILILSLGASCRQGPGDPPAPEPGDQLRLALGREEWLVFDIPRTDVTVGWALAPGGAYERDCYLTEIHNEGGWGRFEQTSDGLREGGLGLKVLQVIGFDLDLRRAQQRSLVALGWGARRAVNIRPNYANRNCLNDDGVPAYPAITSVLFFDSLSVTAADARGGTVALSVTGAVAGAPGEIGARWSLSQSGRLVSGGRSLTVGLRLTTWRKHGEDRTCEEEVSLLAGRMFRLCQNSEVARDFRFRVSGGADGRFTVRCTDVGRGGGSLDTVIGLGEQIVVDSSAQRFTRVFLERAAAGDQFVKLRYLDTRYDRRELTRLGELTAEERQALAGIIMQ